MNSVCLTCLLRSIDHTDVVSELEGTQHSCEDSESQGASDLRDKQKAVSTVRATQTSSSSSAAETPCQLPTGSPSLPQPFPVDCVHQAVHEESVKAVCHFPYIAKTENKTHKTNNNSNNNPHSSRTAFAGY